jgi:hypothetical protein
MEADDSLLGVVVLPPMHTDERDQFQLYVYLSSAQGAAQGGAGDTVR